MLSAGDTTSYEVANWAHNQAAYLGTSHLMTLLVLAHHAFYTANNDEGAPVGQVLYKYSSIAAISDWTGLGRTWVKEVLHSLQVEHGYLTQRPRPQRSGRRPRVIRLFWSTEYDTMRALAREGSSLPGEFLVTARQIELRERVPRLHVVREVEQVHQ